ncbi:MAG: restriction endonuclease subunit S [Spirosomataceae bacterium]
MNKQPHTPSLRFPQFSGNWEIKKLGEVAEFKVTNSFSRDNLNYVSGKVKNIHYGDIHTKFQTLFDLSKENVPFINEEINIDKISNDNYCKNGDILFADASEDLNDVGKSIEIINTNNEPLLGGLHTLLARPKENLFYLGFNGYLFKSNKIRLQIQKESQGAKVLGISISRLSNIELSFPSLPEQEKIAGFLTVVDEKLQALKKKKALLEEYKKGIMQRIFSGQLRFKDAHGQSYPDWEVRKLGEVASFFSGGTPLTTIRDYFNGEIPFIRSGEINSDYTEQFISESGLKNSSAKMVKKGDLLYALYGATSGEVGISKINGAINQAILCIRSIQNIIFLMNYLRYNKEIILKTFLQGGQGNLSADIIKSLEISFPSLPEQEKIAEFLGALDAKIAALQSQLDKTMEWKKGLLQGMFC